MNYERIYNQIIQRAKTEQEQRIQNKKNGIQYYEGHHIIPECMGGDGRADDWLRVKHSNRHHALKGMSKSEEHKQKLRKPKTEEHKQNMKGRYTSPEQRQAISDRLMGHVHSEETRKKISEKTKGRIPWNKGITGKPLTEEHKRKVSEGVRRANQQKQESTRNHT